MNSKKASTLKNKYATKLKIVEENCKLTDEEKKEILKNLQTKIEKLLKHNEKKQDFKEYLHYLSAKAAGEDASKFLTINTVNIVLLLTGLIGVGMGVVNDLSAITALSGVGAGLASVALTNTALNMEIKDDSINEKIATKSMYDSKEIESVLKNLLKEINKSLDAYKEQEICL